MVGWWYGWMVEVDGWMGGVDGWMDGWGRWMDGRIDAGREGGMGRC